MTDRKTALVRLLRAAYPHDSFPDAPYERVADTILAQVDDDLWLKLALEAGLDTLEQAGLDGSQDAETAEKLLHAIEDAEFFKLVRATTVVALYNDHEVWEILGYEGESFSKGGYVDRGFDDLDWLPDARIEEYDGPDAIVEVADADQPSNA